MDSRRGEKTGVVGSDEGVDTSPIKEITIGMKGTTRHAQREQSMGFFA